MDKDTKDFLEKNAKEEANPRALFMAEMLSRVSAMYGNFIDNALRHDKDVGITLMAMVNSGIIRVNTNSTDEAIALINKVADKMKDMVIQLERGVNGLPLKPADDKDRNNISNKGDDDGTKGNSL